MSRLPRMLTALVHSVPTSNTIRKMILLQDHNSYELCVRALQQQGIRPVKQVSAAHMLCCYLDRTKPIESLLQHPRIRRIENDRKVRIHRSSSSIVPIKNKILQSPQRIPWGVKAIHAPAVWSKSRGQGVKVGIIDTGISKHSDLSIAGGYNAIRKSRHYEDDNGHGTHVAGIVAAAGRANLPYGVAPKVALYGIKALDYNGDGYVSNIVEAVEWCIANDMDIINMSLGLDGGSQALRTSISRAHHKGIVVVASSGNSGPNNTVIDEPAIYPETIAVAATDRQKRVPEFSSRGYGIDVCAPGDRIVSTNHQNGFSIDSGTSMAAPHVSGTIALMKNYNPDLSPNQIRELLKDTALQLSYADVFEQGAGLIDAQAAVEQASLVGSNLKRKPIASSLRKQRSTSISTTKAQAARKRLARAQSSTKRTRRSSSAVSRRIKKMSNQ